MHAQARAAVSKSMYSGCCNLGSARVTAEHDSEARDVIATDIVRPWLSWLAIAPPARLYGTSATSEAADFFIILQSIVL